MLFIEISLLTYKLRGQNTVILLKLSKFQHSNEQKILPFYSISGHVIAV